jgi:hypothetical protein
MRGQPISKARNKANTGLRKTPAATISHCFQIGTVPIGLARRAVHPWASLRSGGLMRCLPAVAVSLVQSERAPWLRQIGGIIKASSARACSGPNQGEPLEPRGHRVGRIDRLIAPTARKVDPRLNPTATAIIHKAQGGKPSITHVPHCTGTI